MALALAQVLPRFGAAETGARAKPAEAARSVAELVAEAEQRGRAEAAAASEIRISEMRAAAEADYARRLDEAREQWAETESLRLADGLTTAVAELESRLAAGVARILTPFLAAGARKRALSDLAAMLAELRVDGAAPLLRISGPADLLDGLRQLPAAAALTAEFIATDSVEVTVALDATVVETQLGAWSARLSEALSDG